MQGILRCGRKMNLFVKDTNEYIATKNKHPERNSPNDGIRVKIHDKTSVMNMITHSKDLHSVAPQHPLQSGMKPLSAPVILFDNRMRKKMHKDLFALVQKSVQSGPMKGSKPGKFHVGQERVAEICEAYLTEMLIICRGLDMTVSQKRRLEKWLKGSKRRQLKSKKLVMKREQWLVGEENEEEEVEEEEEEEEEAEEEDFGSFGRR